MVVRILLLDLSGQARHYVVHILDHTVYGCTMDGRGAYFMKFDSKWIALLRASKLHFHSKSGNLDTP